MSIPWKPRRYMVRAVKWMLGHGAAALFLDPGLGKTSISLKAVSVLLKERVARGALVIAPLRVCYLVWRQEAAKWDDTAHLRVELLHGPDKAAALARPADVYLINPDGLPWLAEQLRDKKRSKAFLPDVLLVDESTNFKNTRTQRFKLLRGLLARFRRRYILTGTPAPNGLLDLFGQVYLLDQGRALGQWVSSYRREFFDPSGFGGYDWKLQPGAEERIYQRLRPYVLRLSAEDHLDLPPLVEHDIVVDLPPKARAAYDDMELELLTMLDSGEVVTAASAAVASMKCRQIANGGLYRPGAHQAVKGKRLWADLHDAKTEALQELVAELNGQPLLVAYEFEHDLMRLQRAFGKNLPNLSTGNLKQLASLEAAWNRGELPLLVGQPQSVGHGLNLQYGGCGHVAWYSQFWDLEVYQQFILRVRRQGATALRVVNHHLLARRTVDEVIREVRGAKHRTQAQLLKALQSYRRQAA